MEVLTLVNIYIPLYTGNITEFFQYIHYQINSSQFMYFHHSILKCINTAGSIFSFFIVIKFSFQKEVLVEVFTIIDSFVSSV